MLLEFTLALFLGILAGTITGLTPGLHINLVGSILLALSSSLLLGVSPLYLAIFIVSMSLAHTFIDFIPSIFLGAPDSESALSLLPGHELLLQGRGYEALALSVIGCVSGVVLMLIFTPLFILFLPSFYSLIKPVMILFLILASLFLLSSEKNLKLGLLIFLLSGFLGISSLNLHLKEPLLPLLSGLFGASSLLVSISKSEKIPQQKLSLPKISKHSIIKSAFASSISAPLCSFLPALGSGQAATLSSSIIKTSKEEFLIIIGAINTMVIALSFIALYSINKARTGSAAVISNLLVLDLHSLSILILAITATAIISSILTLYLGNILSRTISKINYRFLSIVVLILLAILVAIFSGYLGFLVFLVSTFTGLSCILLKVRRILLMNCLLLPTILFYI